MNLVQTIDIIKTFAKAEPNIHAVVDQFEDLNREGTKYSAFILQQQQHTRTDDFVTYNFYIGYADRLTEDGSNEIEVQSTAMQVIDDVVYSIRDSFPAVEIGVGAYNVFTQRFTALCAGAYALMSFNVPMNECSEDLDVLASITKTITENGEYIITKPADALGIRDVKIVVNVDNPEAVLQDKTITINANGEREITADPGYTGLRSVTLSVDVPTEGDYQEGYEAGYTQGHHDGAVEGREAGIAEQKSKLTGIEITANGTYDRPDGYDHVVVNVPSSGKIEEGKTVTINENGTVTITPTDPNVVWTSVTIATNVPTEGGYQEGYEAGYAAGRQEGYNEGFEAGRQEGIAQQKAKLEEITINENGTYEKEDGYKKVIVDVPSSPVVPTQEKNLDVDANGGYEVTPDEGYNLSKVTVNVNVPVRPEPSGTIDITENGDYDVSDYANAHVNISTPGQKYVVPNGMKFGYTNLDKMPEELDFSQVTDFDSLFFGSSIKEVPDSINWANATGLGNTFYNCYNIENVDGIVFDNVSYMGTPFAYSKIKHLPAIEPKVQNTIYSLVADVHNLESIERIDFSNTYTYIAGYDWDSAPPLSTCPIVGSLGGNYGSEDDLNFAFSKMHNNVDFDSFKSIFEAALRNGVKPDDRTWTMSFNTMFIDDEQHTVQTLMEECVANGWVITGITFVDEDPFTIRLASGENYFKLSDTDYPTDQLIITCPEGYSWNIPYKTIDVYTKDGGLINFGMSNFVGGLAYNSGTGDAVLNFSQDNHPSAWNLDNFEFTIDIMGPTKTKKLRVVYNYDDGLWMRFGDGQAMHFHYDNHSVLRFVDDNGNELRVNNSNIQNYIHDERLVGEGSDNYVFGEIRKSDFPGWKLVAMGSDSTVDDHNIYTHGYEISGVAHDKYIIRDIEYLDATYFHSMRDWRGVNYINSVLTSSNLTGVSFTSGDIKSIPSFITPNVEKFKFSVRADVNSIPAYDGHGIKNSYRMITNTSENKNTNIYSVGGFDGIGTSYNDKTQDAELHTIDFDYVPNVAISDIVNQFNMLATLGEGVLASIYLTTGQNAQISDADKAIATNKGWTIKVRNS